MKGERRLVQVVLDRALMREVDKFAIDSDLKRGPAMEMLLLAGLVELEKRVDALEGE